ncbi:MAG: metal-dependent hydrolase [Pirellulales bacterium]
MAGFRTHITTSTVLGIGYGTVALFAYDVPLPACLLAGGLCSVSGMLPDLDSGPGRPLRESTTFAAAVVPMLLLDRFREAGWSNETIILVGAGIYLSIRFGVHWLLSRYTVHRGMFHSLPACLIAAELAMLAFSGNPLEIRYFKAGGVVLGFMSHLVLDELWSIEWQRGRIVFKKSFGTAIKLWGDSLWANVSTYGKLAFLTFVCLKDPTLRDNLEDRSRRFEQIAKEKVEQEREHRSVGSAERTNSTAATTPTTTTTSPSASGAAPAPRERPWDRLVRAVKPKQEPLAEAPAVLNPRAGVRPLPADPVFFEQGPHAAPLHELPTEVFPAQTPAPAAPLWSPAEDATRFPSTFP